MNPAHQDGGKTNRPESLSKYWPEAVANSADSAAGVRISAPMRISPPATPKASFTILLPGIDPGLTAMIAGPSSLSASAILRDYPLLADTGSWMVYRSSRLLALKVRAFIDYFAERYGTAPYWHENPGVYGLPSVPIGKRDASKFTLPPLGRDRGAPPD